MQYLHKKVEDINVQEPKLFKQTKKENTVSHEKIVTFIETNIYNNI